MSIAREIHLVINARTDAYLETGESIQSLRHAIDRGNAYKEAGADRIFVPDNGNLDKNGITSLVKEIDAPINIIAGAADASHIRTPGYRCLTC